MKRQIGLIWLFVLFSLVVVWAFHWMSLPPAIRAYQFHPEAYQRFVADIREDKISQRRNGEGFTISQQLYSDGVRYVRKEGDCIVFLFESLPPDAIPTLVYVPFGDNCARSRFGNKCYVRQKLGEHWYFEELN